jgi:hypothetical protein
VFPGLSTGHVKRVPVRGMQGPLKKQRINAFALPLRRGALTRKPCSSMPSKWKETRNSWPARAKRKCIWNAEISLLDQVARWHAARLSDESPKKTRILNPEHFSEVHDPFLFSAPPLTSPRRHDRMSSVQHGDMAAHVRLRCARACMDLRSAGAAAGHVKRVPVRGMQGPFEVRSKKLEVRSMK